MTDLRPFFDRYAAAWAARDADAIAELHAEDGVFHLHAGQEPVRGREAIRETFAGFFAQYPDLAFELVDVRFGSDHWAVEWKMTSGAFEVDLADVVTVEDGRVASKQSYVDAVALQEQLEAAAAPVPDAAPAAPAPAAA
jgi:ketosteroid isomerase-like protein